MPPLFGGVTGILGNYSACAFGPYRVFYGTGALSFEGVTS